MSLAAGLSSPDDAGRAVETDEGMRLLHGVQKYSLWFNGFSHAELERLLEGVGPHKLRVSRVYRGDVVIRHGQAASRRIPDH